LPHPLSYQILAIFPNGKTEHLDIKGCNKSLALIFDDYMLQYF